MYLLCRSLDLVRSNISFFEGSNSTGAKPYSRHSTLLSTGANVPVAPVESAPMNNYIWRLFFSLTVYISDLKCLS